MKKCPQNVFQYSYWFGDVSTFSTSYKKFNRQSYFSVPWESKMFIFILSKHFWCKVPPLEHYLPKNDHVHIQIEIICWQKIGEKIKKTSLKNYSQKILRIKKKKQNNNVSSPRSVSLSKTNAKSCPFNINTFFISYFYLP